MPLVFDIYHLSLNHSHRRPYAFLEYAFEIGAKRCLSELERHFNKNAALP